VADVCFWHKADIASHPGLAAACYVAWPFAAPQQPMMPIVGLLSPRSPEDSSRLGAAFRKALNEAGYIEARTSL
jgi:hypothetical protein